MNFNEINPLEYNKYTFGKCIKKRREELGLSIRGLSRMIGISAAYMSDIEKGYRKPPFSSNTKRDYMSDFIHALKIPDDQIEAFRNIAFGSRGYYEDIKEYLENHLYARKAILIAKEINLSEEEWKNIVNQIKKQSS